MPRNEQFVISYSKTLFMQSCMNVHTQYITYHYMKRYNYVVLKIRDCLWQLCSQNNPFIFTAYYDCVCIMNYGIYKLQYNTYRQLTTPNFFLIISYSKTNVITSHAIMNVHTQYSFIIIIITFEIL